MKAIVTRSDKNIKAMTDLTHPIMRKYAKKVNADFIIFDHKPEVNTYDNKPHYRILKAYSLFDKYDRILFLDSDMVINKKCPNIFDVVPEDFIGSVYEDVGSRRKQRRSLIRSIQKEWGNVGWETGYTNAGTYVVSKKHKDIFTKHDGKYWTGWGSVDVHLSYMTHKLGFKIHELPFQFNHMTMFSEKWNGKAKRDLSHIIHYAGSGIFDKRFKSRNAQIKHDIERIYKK